MKKSARIALVALLLASACGPESLTLSQAWKQDWAGGRQETGRGTNYTLLLVAGASSQEIQLGGLWVGQEHYDYNLRNRSGGGGQDFRPGDTLELVASRVERRDRNSGQSQVFTSETPMPPPREYSGAALLLYDAGGQTAALLVPAFDERPRENRP